MAEETFDYIVVGAGSAGCAVAARLSESGRDRVLLLEAGPRDTNPWIHLPIGYAKTFVDETVNWKYETEPEPHLDNRRIYWPRGKTLGGSSSINGLIYIRGVPSDYDYWRQLGNAGWAWSDLLPFFRKAERNVRDSDELHSSEGLLGVEEPRWRNVLSDAWLEAAQQAGHQHNADFNGRRQEGSGYYQLTEWGGRRCSAARAYLAPAKGRANLRIVTGALAERIELDGGRATGLRYRLGSGAAGEATVARAKREIVLCGGAINSPQLLMLSGIGPAEHLREVGIETKHAVPGIGANLHDHLQIKNVWRVKQPVTHNDLLRGPLGKVRAGLHWVAMRGGPLSVGAGLCGVFARTRPELADPDVQMHYTPWSTDKMGTALHPFPGFSVVLNQSRPQSRGRLWLKTPSARDKPAMLANYLAEEVDRRTMVDGLKLMRAIGRQKALAPWVEQELSPGPAVESDADLLAYLRTEGQSIYHPVGTCRMGPEHDPMAVVDQRLKLHGVAGLRVADASVMPQVISGNTNAACIMIGEKAAAMIAEDARAA